MRRRIFFSMLSLTVLSLLISAVAISFVFYNQLSASVQNDVRERAHILQTAIIADEYKLLSIPDMRLTVISANGAVIYDDDEDIKTLANHSDRVEIVDALTNGEGESKRFSDSLGKETYYYAVLLSDGTVLRLAKTTSSIWGVFGGALPIVVASMLLIIILNFVLADRLTRRIVRPINEVDLSGTLSAPYDELVPFVKTIELQRTQITRQLDDLRERSDTMQTIMENMGEGIILLNKKGIIINANKSAASFFGLSDSVDGKNILEIFREVEFSALVRGALNGHHGERAIKQDEKTYHAFFSPIADIGVIILFMDVTEKAKAEMLRREFSANVSHELKTPLTLIYGNAEMLSGGMVKDEDKAVFYDKIKDEAGRMITLIEDIMLLSRLDETSHAEVSEDVELSALASEAINALEIKASENAVTVVLNAVETSVKANRTQIYELLFNLIDNAIKYNRSGGTVEVDISPINGKAQIRVSDTGIGIPKEAQNRVFERFYRVDKSRSKQTGGTGLGLAIVKHIVMAHGGKISLISDERSGTIISVLFDLSQ